jgi:hypothetical protein
VEVRHALWTVQVPVRLPPQGAGAVQVGLVPLLLPEPPLLLPLPPLLPLEPPLSAAPLLLPEPPLLPLLPELPLDEPPSPLPVLFEVLSLLLHATAYVAAITKRGASPHPVFMAGDASPAQPSALLRFFERFRGVSGAPPALESSAC